MTYKSIWSVGHFCFKVVTGLLLYKASQDHYGTEVTTWFLTEEYFKPGQINSSWGGLTLRRKWFFRVLFLASDDESAEAVFGSSLTFCTCWRVDKTHYYLKVTRPKHITSKLDGLSNYVFCIYKGFCNPLNWTPYTGIQRWQYAV